MVKIRTKVEKVVEPKLLKVHLKVRDEFSATLVSADGETIKTQDDGYVPSFMPGNHYGDYVILDIDIDTGQITNWKRPSEGELLEWIGKDDE